MSMYGIKDNVIFRSYVYAYVHADLIYMKNLFKTCLFCSCKQIPVMLVSVNLQVDWVILWASSRCF